jgi:hypothetical protein
MPLTDQLKGTVEDLEEAAADAVSSGKHTRGPWAVSQWCEITAGVDRDGDDLVLAAVGRPHHSRGACSVVKGPAQRANARLIAAAPDLLSFAQWVAGLSSGQHADPWDMLKHIEEVARAAIAKAEGRS